MIVVAAALELLNEVSSAYWDQYAKHSRSCTAPNICWNVNSSTGTATLVCTGCNKNSKAAFRFGVCSLCSYSGPPDAVYIPRKCNSCQQSVEYGYNALMCHVKQCSHAPSEYRLPKRTCEHCGAPPPSE
ncbi:hypothetical protein PGT21_032754 [Puccinia graminis f. sp. tritici]|nr:hypothetical protein PGT21_032754 [Puccinia graminis f. sp. tritici]